MKFFLQLFLVSLLSISACFFAFYLVFSGLYGRPGVLVPLIYGFLFAPFAGFWNYLTLWKLVALRKSVGIAVVVAGGFCFGAFFSWVALGLNEHWIGAYKFSWLTSWILGVVSGGLWGFSRIKNSKSPKEFSPKEHIVWLIGFPQALFLLLVFGFASYFLWYKTPIRFVFPDSFEGPFYIFEIKGCGFDLSDKGFGEVKVPGNGYLAVEDFGDMSYRVRRAKFENGEEIERWVGEGNRRSGRSYIFTSHFGQETIAGEKVWYEKYHIGSKWNSQKDGIPDKLRLEWEKIILSQDSKK